MTTTSGAPDVVGVVGGGRMGAGIAHAFLLAGARVTVMERDDEAAAAAKANVLASVARSVARLATTETHDELIGRFSVTTQASDLGAAELVVEAVPEVLALKSEILSRVSRELSGTAWLTSNTSSISIATLADHVMSPERFGGLHFFNPVPSSTLVEIVRSERTAPELVELSTVWVRAIGKTPIVVKDSPGFASSRLGVIIAIEAMRMLEEGVASAADIDAAMVLGYKFLVGPLRLTDVVGLDVRLGIADYLSQTLGDRFDPPKILREKVAAGQLGRKSGSGFFEWDD